MDINQLEEAMGGTPEGAAKDELLKLTIKSKPAKKTGEFKPSDETVSLANDFAEMIKTGNISMEDAQAKLDDLTAAFQKDCYPEKDAKMGTT